MSTFAGLDDIERDLTAHASEDIPKLCLAVRELSDALGEALDYAREWVDSQDVATRLLDLDEVLRRWRGGEEWLNKVQDRASKVASVLEYARRAERLERALRTLLAACRGSWLTWHVWWPGPDGTHRCILPQCAACKAEQGAETVLANGNESGPNWQVQTAMATAVLRTLASEIQAALQPDENGLRLPPSPDMLRRWARLAGIDDAGKPC